MPTPCIDALETRRLFAFVSSGASTVTGDEFQSVDRTLALPGGGYVSAGIFGEDTDFGLGKLYQPKGDSDVFLTMVKKGKTSLFTIGGSSSQDLDTDDDRADFAGDPSRVGDDFPFGVDSRIRGADEYVSQMKVGPDGKLYVALIFRRTASLNTNNPRAPKLVAADEFAGNYADSAILRYDISGSKLAYEASMQIGGPFNDFIYDFDFDSSGNILVVGSYERRMDFDPSSKVFNQEPDGRSDGFVAKYSKNFGLLWVDNFGGDTGDDERPDAVYSVAVDTADKDAIYIGGSFARTADFDPRAGKTRRLLIKAGGATDGYTAKLNASGTLAWVRIQGGDGYDAVKRVTLAPDGVYNVGYFEDGADLDSDPDVKDEHDVNDDEDGDTDLFFTRFADDGDQLWVKQLSGDGIELVADAMTAGNGDLVIAGSFYGTTDFDTSAKRSIRTTADVGSRDDSNNGDRDNAYAGFVAVYGSNAKFRRVGLVTGQGEEDVFITGATIAAGGNVSVAGRYRRGFGVNDSLIVSSSTDAYRDQREDGYSLVFGSGLTPIV